MKRPCPENKYIIALTGGIATGKSFVSEHVKKLGADLVDTDEIARRVVNPGSPVLKKIEQTWGKEMINPDGTLNRKALGNIIFSSEDDRKKLNSIMHPEIRRVMYEEVKNSPKQIVFIDIPLLFESKVPIPYDESWLVYCTKEQQKQRLVTRDKITEEEALKRIKSQIDIDEKRKMADYIIENTGNKEETQNKLGEMWDGLKKRIVDIDFS